MRVKQSDYFKMVNKEPMPQTDPLVINFQRLNNIIKQMQSRIPEQGSGLK